MRKEVVYIEHDHWNELAKYYNEHHDEIREKGFRNFSHWLGVLSYSGFIENEKINKVRHELMRNTPNMSSLGKTYNISSFAFPDFIKNLWKSIGEKDPRTVQCDNCTDICRAYITIEGECPPLATEEPT